MNDIEQILNNKGPMLSSKLAKELIVQGVSDQTARKRISRRNENIRELRGLPFPKGAKFLFTDKQFGTAKFYDALYDAIKETSPPYAAALSGMRARGGIVLKEHFTIISGAPIAQKKQLSSNVIMERFKAAKLLHEHEVIGAGTFLYLDGSHDEITFLRACLSAENVLLDAMNSWLGKMNMASSGKIETRSKESLPKFSTFHFDLVGPSYLRPMSRFNKNNGKLDPGFIVADIILGKAITESDVVPFIKKCKALSNIRNNRPFLPMYIADEFEINALKVCRAEGIIVTTPGTLFGKDVSIALRDLIKTLQNAAANAAVSPDKIEKLLSSLSKIEGTAKNLRGALFELIVGHLVKLEGYNIDIGKIIYHQESEKSAEMDVRGIKEKQIKVYECRGHQPTIEISGEDIEKWFRKISIIYKGHKEQYTYQNKEFQFEFWTTGQFSIDALRILSDFSKKTNKYSIAWKDGKEIEGYVKSLDSPGIRKILAEHYFNHPLKNNS